MKFWFFGGPNDFSWSFPKRLTGFFPHFLVWFLFIFFNMKPLSEVEVFWSFSFRSKNFVRPPKKLFFHRYLITLIKQNTNLKRWWHIILLPFKKEKKSYKIFDRPLNFTSKVHDQRYRVDGHWCCIWCMIWYDWLLRISNFSYPGFIFFSVY